MRGRRSIDVCVSLRQTTDRKRQTSHKSSGELTGEFLSSSEIGRATDEVAVALSPSVRALSPL